MARKTKQIPRGRAEQRATFYVREEEVLDIERVLLDLLTAHRLKADKSAVVRSMLNQAIAEYATSGPGAAWVRRMKEEELPRG